MFRILPIISVVLPFAMVIGVMLLFFRIRDSHPNYFVGKLLFPRYNPMIRPSGTPKLPLFPEGVLHRLKTLEDRGEYILVQDDNGYMFESHKKCGVHKCCSTRYEHFHTKRILLQAWKNIADELDIFWYPIFGTLLEAHRNREIMYDYDIDIMIDINDMKKMHLIDTELLDKLKISPNIGIQILPALYENFRGLHRKRFMCSGIETHVYAKDRDMCSDTWGTHTKMFLFKNEAPEGSHSVCPKGGNYCFSLDVFTVDFDANMMNGFYHFGNVMREDWEPEKTITLAGVKGVKIPKATLRILKHEYMDLAPDKICDASGKWVKKVDSKLDD